MTTQLGRELQQEKPFASLEEEVYLSLQLTAQVVREPWARYLKAKRRLSPSQYNLLRILRGAHPSGLTCTEIAERMVNRDPDVTRLVDRLAKRRWVRRQRGRADRRVVKVFITAGGLDRLESLDPAAEEFPGKLLGHLGKKRLRDLRDLLAALRKGLGEFP